MRDHGEAVETVVCRCGARRGGGERCGVVGRYRYRLIGPDGKVKQEGRGRNIWTDKGSEYVADALALTQNFSSPPAGMKLGTSTQSPAKGDTDCVTPLAGSFKAFDSGFPKDDSPQTNQANYRVTWAAGQATQSGLAECVVKSADGSSDAVSRFLLSPVVNKGADDTLEVTLSVDFDGV